jgi:NAD(P)-dependent dehydrogenase (short-subunit alcohol dehydrogenase family)
MAANGADVVAIDIACPVSPASNAVPATPEELEETVRMIQGFGRRSQSIKADIRDIGALRAAADQIEQMFGKIDIVVPNAAIQRSMPLLQMEDTDWRDVIDNNLNGTANTVRAFAPKMVARKKGRFILLATGSRGYRINPIRKAVERVDLGNRTKGGTSYAAGGMGRPSCHRAAQGRLASA